jgi:peptide/nickel transport system substrate-binding protein
MNLSRYDDPTYRALIQKGIATKDGADRDAVYKQCEQMVADQNVWLLISHSKNLCGYNPKVQGFYYHQTGITPFAGVTKTK